MSSQSSCLPSSSSSSSLCFCLSLPHVSSNVFPFPHCLLLLSHILFSSSPLPAFPPNSNLFFVPSRPSSLSSPSSRFLHFETSALTAGCQTTRRFYPQFTSSHNEDAGRSRCRVQTLKAAIRRSLWVSFGEEVKVGVWCLMLETAECFLLMRNLFKSSFMINLILCFCSVFGHLSESQREIFHWTIFVFLHNYGSLSSNKSKWSHRVFTPTRKRLPWARSLTGLFYFDLLFGLINKSIRSSVLVKYFISLWLRTNWQVLKTINAAS